MRNAIQYLSCLIVLVTGPLHAQSVGGTTSGAASYCDSINSGFISLTGHNGLILYWEESTNNQGSWNQLQNTTSTQSYNQLKITTSYRAIVQDGSFPPDTSTVSTITVHVPGIAGSVSGAGSYCSGANNGTLSLSGTQGNVLFWQFRENGGPWLNITNTTFKLPFNNLTKPTTYRAVVQRVPGCNADTSATSLLEIDEPTISGTISGDDSLCFGAAGDTLVLSGQRGVVLDWIVTPDEGQSWESTQSGGTSYVYPHVIARRWYAVTVKNGVCEADTTTPAKIVPFRRVIANAGPDATIQRLESIQLQGEANGNVQWSPKKSLSDSTVVSPVANPVETTVYKIQVTDQHDCSASDSVKITVIIPVPSAITPNGDGVNDSFEIYDLEKFEKNRLQVYDRWGVLVYEASPYKNEWDGKYKDGSAIPEDTYFFVFDKGQGEKPVSGYILVKR